MSDIDLWQLLKLTQEHIARNYTEVLSQDKNKQLKLYISQYIIDHNYNVLGCDKEALVNRLYQEMAEYSIITDYLQMDNVEEINVNAWDDITINYHNGTVKKLEQHFESPRHAIDIIKRLLQHSNMIIDNATPIAQGHLPNDNTRITAIKTPIVDETCGIAASIRLLHKQKIKLKDLEEFELGTKEMLELLENCMRYGVSMVIAGATSSGKTTLLNALLSNVPIQKRIVTIESGARELSLVQRDKNGKILNNVVHMLSRPSDNQTNDISQEDLVVASLRYNPDIVAVGEMRDIECYAAVEASLTGHAVVSTVHSGAGEAAHTRIGLLCQKRYPIDFQTSILQVAQAFPIIVYMQQLANNQRKIMDISECVIDTEGKRHYNTLYKYEVSENRFKSGRYEIEGRFQKENKISNGLLNQLKQHGAPEGVLFDLCGKE